MERKYCLAVVGLCLLMMLVFTACAQSSEKTEATPSENQREETQEAKDYEPVTIQNGDRAIEFTEMPQRVVTYGHPTEVMLALGLEEYMAATGVNADDILTEYKEEYSQIPYLHKRQGGAVSEYISQEKLLEVNPDFVYSGFNHFQEDILGTVERLEELGIKAYLHQSSNMTQTTVDDVYEDIRNIGRIFHVEDRADKLIQSLDDSMNKVEQRIESQIGTVDEPLRVFVYHSGEDTAYTATQNLMTDLIQKAGGKNILDDVEGTWVKVAWEAIVEGNPEVIVILDSGDPGNVKHKKEFLLNHPALSDVSAIKNERFGVIPLPDTYEGVRVAKLFEGLAKSFYPEVFE